MCGLEEYGDAIVGSLGVEHRKRTTIGVELAAKVCSATILDIGPNFNIHLAKTTSLP
jgi:ATP-binding cassette, subfamily G (WHITE), member 2, SNQ2